MSPSEKHPVPEAERDEHMSIAKALLELLQQQQPKHHVALSGLLSVYRHIALRHPCCMAVAAEITAELSAELRSHAVIHKAAGRDGDDKPYRPH